MSVWVKFTDNQADLIQSEFRVMRESGAGYEWEQIADKVRKAIIAAMKAEKPGGK